MLNSLRKRIDKFLEGPERQYKVVYLKDNVWTLSGWYVRARGGGMGWFWSYIHTYPFDSKLIALHEAHACARVQGGTVIHER